MSESDVPDIIPDGAHLSVDESRKMLHERVDQILDSFVEQLSIAKDAGSPKSLKVEQASYAEEDKLTRVSLEFILVDGLPDIVGA